MSSDFPPEEVRKRNKEKNDEARKKGRRQLIFLIVVVLCVVGVTAVLYLTLPSDGPHQVSGTVKCTSGRAVQGVWVKEARDTGSWAIWDADPHDPSIAYYKQDVQTKTYGVNIGCGGTPHDWQGKPTSDYVSGNTNNFVCHDKPGEANYDKCEVSNG